MQLAALFSGGKDSAYSAYLAQSEGHEVKVLIAIESENPESYMFHVPNIHIVKMQAKAMEIPLIFISTKGVKEEELEDLKEAIIEAKNEYGIEGIVSGAIYSNYQRKRIDNIAAELEIASLSPLWKKKPRDMLTDMVDEGFKIIMSAVAAGGLGPKWLGKEINFETIVQLSDLHNTCYVCTAGEGGEFETLVLDAPNFKKRIEITEVRSHWDGMAGVYEVISAQLIEK
jgi:ABC transporter with metal-binding/Fe-S-binding domain ATP-binding protein